MLRSWPGFTPSASLFTGFLLLACGRTDLGLEDTGSPAGGSTAVGGSAGSVSVGGSSGSSPVGGSSGSVAVGGAGATGGSGAVGGVGAAAGVGGTPVGGNAGQGGSPVGNCSVNTECRDFDECTTNRCVNGSCVFTERDDDGDGFTSVACGGGDCNDLNPNTFPFAPEICGDGDDNDCNGVADCLDPVCASQPACGCQPDPNGENCSNGEDDDCDTIVDCLDTDCVNTPACGCAPTEAGLCDNGFDDDCDGAFDCDDAECFSDPLCQCQAFDEQCTNGQDEDCDLLVDCADPDCQAHPSCGCVPPGVPESCSNLDDDDCDGLRDCADPDCINSPACEVCEPENCTDGIDNDCDDRIDCADDSCAFDPNCTVQAEICNNGADDDLDMLVDCQDPDCANTPICEEKQSNCLSPRIISASGSYTGDTTGNVGETKGSCGGDAGEALFQLTLDEPSRLELDTIGTSFDSVLYVKKGSCEAGREIGCDDDSGGSAWSARLEFTILNPGTYFIFVDGFTIDPQGGANEGPFVLNVEIEPNPQEQCADGIDNDGDQYVDCADPECVNAMNCFNCNGGQPPGPEFGVGACTDGQDNDCDGDVDCADSDCSASDYYVTECCNGQDQNGNGIPDDFNCRCASNADCGPGEICYTDTAYACGLPCGNFFGDVCPFVAPGSSCNQATQQCQF